MVLEVILLEFLVIRGQPIHVSGVSYITISNNLLLVV
jgi:hypothetical protein